ncbi:ABC transporter G family member 21-like [Olea europaea var. sylvestris]|uniref:ABC transporter G family member 21 n=1 Tax=Olea europaea subsp. europaea TaxID=158383 RepID=A0A8S0QND7_OLEEU|nr:ABC transporter G family member 21-like [Olea europaea var. sylvestris]CAA2967144.1 ABC transporter G family member 21 [Olea europaea subsp. europaea]
MPFEQDINGVAANALVRNRTHNISLPVEPPGSTGNVSSSPVDQIQEQNHANTVRISVLRESLRPITLKFEDVSYAIELRENRGNCFSSPQPKVKRNILDGVSGVVRPGELLAMLGPSGSGKTTLLTALSSRLPGKISGSITYNGHPFSSSTKRKTGFVTQDDVLYPHLTVLETLTYASLLRLPNKLTRQEKIEHAELTIMELGLTTCRNSMIGGPLFRGISGGERKRVSIGQEMLVNPSLLLLDEPTSGLDSTTAQRIMATLRKLACSGRTVITTIHQPSSSLYMMFDKILVLSEGCPIYSGSANKVMDYFASIGYKPGFHFMNPADFLLDLANGVNPEARQDDQMEFHGSQNEHNATKQFLISSYKKNLLPILKEEIQRASQDEIHPGKSLPSRSSENQWTNSWWLQFKVLLSRGLKERRHESFSGLRIFQVLSVSIVSGLLWWHSDTNHIQDQVGLLFFFSIFWGFFPLFNAVFTFPQERPMLTRELSSGMYRLSSYYLARIAGDLPMELVLPIIFTTITYWMSGLKPSLITFLLTLSIVLLNVLVSQGLGLALGAVLMDVKQAATLSSVMILVFLLASGYYVQHMPPYINCLKYFSFSHYCYKFLVAVQYSKNEVYECGWGGKECRVQDFPAIKYLGIDSMVVDMAALIVMLVGYRVLAYVALRLRQPH